MVPAGAAGTPAAAEDMPIFADPHLVHGRKVWMGTCSGCHADGTAGAPIATDAEAWKPRIAQGIAVLYEHALNGFFGPEYNMMPARGGNDALKDDEVKAAVDYMVGVASGEKE
jgi:cytochrome c5